MRTREVAREALRNVRAGTSRPLAQFLSTLVLLVLLGAMDGVSIANTVGAYRAFVSSGATVTTATGPNAFDGQVCESFRDFAAVSASGAARELGTVTFDLMPSNPVPLWEVTPGFARMLTGDSAGSMNGLVLSQQVAESIGRTTGDTVGIEDQTATIAELYTYPDDGRTAGFGWAALTVVPATGDFDQCWVDVPSSDTDLALLPLAAANPGTSGDTSVGQLNSTFGNQFDLEARLAERPSRIAPWLSLALAALTTFVLMRLRRVQLASALHVGLPRLALTAQTLFETVIACVPALCVVSAGFIIFAWTADPAEPWVLLGPLMKTVAGSLVGSVLGALIGAMLVNERVLYRSFRDRG